MSSSFHGSIIGHTEVKKCLPDRLKFLNQTDKQEIDKILNKKEPIMFLPTYLYETHMQDEKYQKAKYKIVLMGILRDGRKISVILDGITPFFEVLLNDGTVEQQEAEINTILSLLEVDETLDPVNKSLISSKPFKYYREHKSKFLRLYYNKTKSRTAAINLLRKNNYSTTSDDLSSYYRVVCRDYKTTFSSWVVLNNYVSDQVSTIKGEVYRLKISDYTMFTGELVGDYLRDKTMSLCWDIETWSDDGSVPLPENKSACMFCIGMTFQWVHDKEPFLKLCLVDYPAKAKPGYLTVTCGTEKNLITTFGDVFSLLRPDFIFGFNDSDYDWNWLVLRGATYKGVLARLATSMDSTVPYAPYTDETVLKYNFRKERIKIEATTYAEGTSLMIHGYIPMDVRTVFRKLYPTSEESSLKWFLSKNKLGGKEDMPYERMFRIYGEYRSFVLAHGKEINTVISGDTDLPTMGWDDTELTKYNRLKEELADVNYYCIVDAQRCHDLMNIRCVVMDKREVSHLAYTSVADAFYRADGLKVRNLTIGIGQEKPFSMRFSNITNNASEDGKYPGAFVFPPKKGLRVTKLSIEERIRKAEMTKDSNMKACQEWLNTTIDEVQTYHKIIEKYGAIVPEEQIPSIEEAESIKIPKKFRSFLTEPIGRPITGLDFSSLYPSLIRTYNFSPEYCVLDKKYAQELAAKGHRLTKVDFDFNGRRRVAYFVWHNNKLDRNDPEFRFGIYPYILDDLFNKRKILKSKMKHFDHRKEEIEAMSEEEQKKLAAEYDEIVFNKNYLNSKQNALKVFMNTFYGEAGNKLSPFFVLEVAGGVTSYGQKNIKLAFAYVKQNECQVYYGDSVAGYTPVLLRKRLPDGTYSVRYTTIESIQCEYSPYNGGKEISFLKDVQIWSDTRWTAVKHLIRHKVGKKMYRIATNTGIVDVTADHSLLTSSGLPIKPTECKVGTKLLTKEPPKYTERVTQYEESLSFKKQVEDYLAWNSDEQPILTVDTQLEAAIIYRYCKIAFKCDLAIDTTFNYTVKILRQPLPEGIVSISELKTVDCYVYDFETESHHFAAGVGNLVVHNTDSLYLSTPEKAFKPIDIAYYTGKIQKLEYWTKLVETTFSEINPIRDGVNTAFYKDNGTKFLSMAYEEVLYPVAFTAKKKYFGIAHENIPNFKPKELFVRGLEVKKRGVSALLRKIFNEIMWTSCNPDNLYDLIELVTAKIDEIYSRKWSSADFIQTGVLRTGKSNVKLITFARRMAEKGIVIKPNERFNYVIVKKYPYSYDLRGRKSNLSMGDKLELAEVYEKEGMEIDLDYYMQGSINGQLARLVTYHDMFQQAPIDTSEEEMKVAEAKTYKNACKFVDTYCEKYYANYNTFGKAHQKIYKTASKAVGNVLKEYDSVTGQLLSANVDYDDFESWFVSYTESVADKSIGEYGKEFVLEDLDKVSSKTRDRLSDASAAEIKKEVKLRRDERLKDLQKSYYGKEGILPKRELEYKNTMAILRSQLRSNLETYMTIYRKYNKGVEDIMSMIKAKVNITDELFKPTKEATDYKLEDFDVTEELDEQVNEVAVTNASSLLDDKKIIEGIKKLKTMYTNMLSAHVSVKRVRDIVSYLKVRRDHENRVIVRPDDSVIAAMRQRDSEANATSIASIEL